jgi:MerR family transcriptional regulator, redox-sensitive transcriptional activator SoxR
MSNSAAGPDGPPSLTIGAVARLTGKSASAIRYYEQIGLLSKPVRAAGRRRYDMAAVRTLAVIETGQRAGLALDEIKLLLSASPGDPATVERLREVASRKLPEVVALIERSRLVRDWLELAARCECPDLDDCPLFDEPELPPGEHRQPRRGGLPAGRPGRGRWDRAKISEGTRILDRVMRLRRPGPCQFQAAIAACHAAATDPGIPTGRRLPRSTPPWPATSRPRRGALARDGWEYGCRAG